MSPVRRWGWQVAHAGGDRQDGAVSTRAKGDRRPAAQLPVARICVDVPLPHLDRAFDYLVPEELDAGVRPGTRVRVRFAGQLVGGWVLDRAEASTHDGKLTFLDRLVSPEPVLTPEVARLARAVADRYAGHLADVLRLAVPPRHARVEQEAAPQVEAPPAAATPPDGRRAAAVAPPPDRPPAPDPHGWTAYPAGAAYLRALAAGRPARAVWTPLPGEDWATRYAEAIAATVVGGRGAVAVVPDGRDLDRLDQALRRSLGPGRHAVLSAALGPARRYRAFLAGSRGRVPVVIGTRAAMFAPVPELGLVAIWDDGDDVHAEPRAPYPHAREVLLTRAQLGDAAALLGGYARSGESQQLVETGWAHDIVAGRAEIRRRAPRVSPTGDDPDLARDAAASTARLPSLAYTAARSALQAGTPVLVQVPRRGYLPAVSCADCRTPVRCAHCAGPLALRSATATPSCRWCGRPAAGYACPHCQGRRLRAAVTGARRTAEELGRAFPDVPVRTSGRDEVLTEVTGEAAVVVATPGAEPAAAGGYGAVLLLDTWALLTRADLRAGEEALRRWLSAAALARPAADGGRVVVVADGGLAPVQALLRWDPAWYAARELADRRELGFPPVARMASLTGTAEAVAELLAAVRLPTDAELLGPVPVGDDQERMLIRVRRSQAAELARELRAAAGARALRKTGQPVRIQVDPLDLL
ncbi:primosomal protein N' [Solwaraspora sp. WMMD406]|nr:primosomal protein N' [Solwaraspora sp. WMMD406]MDG4766484.1 primosomal protein N' [Solwaraspora sp. WMMD406]